jgi:hypothetical protein
MEQLMRLLAAEEVNKPIVVLGSVLTYLRALVFLLLRLRRRTLFFLHLALIFVQIRLEDVSGIHCIGRETSNCTDTGAEGQDIQI